MDYIHIPMILLNMYMLFQLSKIDIEKFLLPDRLTLPLLVLNVILASVTIGYTNALIAASVAMVFGVILQYFGKGKFGGGDVKLYAALAPTFIGHTFPYFFYLVGLSLCLSVLYAVITKKLNKNTNLPLGPFIAVAWTVVVGVGILTGIYV